MPSRFSAPAPEPEPPSRPTFDDVYARELGYVIKLLARSIAAVESMLTRF